MKGVFADTSFFVALVNVRDALHDGGVEAARAIRGRVVTTEFVLIEVGNILARSVHRMQFVKLVKDLRERPNLHIVPLSAHLLEEGLDLYARRADKRWSLTDCISFVVMEQMGLTEALSADHHFERAGFVALLG